MVESTFAVGEMIENRYRVRDVVGVGGMGTLYRVVDEARGDVELALKTLAPDLAQGEHAERVERFQREFQVLAQLQHPNLVAVHEYGVTGMGELYFTMEWVAGVDLNPEVRRLAPERVVAVIVEICRALGYLHARGVLHGDLKPHNVLLAGERVKLVDFGVALELGAAVGGVTYFTPGYAAPETVAQGRRMAVDHRADLYSLGALWYTLLVGEPPLFMEGAGRERLVRFTLLEALEAQPEVPAGVAEIVVRLLASAPGERYGSANEVIAAVNGVTGAAYALETQETASSYALRTRFVDREAEWATLVEAWGRSREGVGQLVLIRGESGVGKTRLVEELEVEAELGGARVVWGQCVAQGGAYQPWREVVRVLLRYVEVEAEAVVQAVGPVLATLFPELWERAYLAGEVAPVTLEPQAARRRLNRALLRVLEAAGRARATVVVIEDAQWGDEATLELVRFLARRLGGLRLQVCVLYRSEEVGAGHPLEELTGTGVVRIGMAPLGPERTRELACALLGLEQLPGLLETRLQETTGGNALFVQELVRSLAAEGEVLRRTVTGWEVDEGALRAVELPASIRQVVGRRLGQLPGEAREVLEWGAVVGVLFWEGAVAGVGRVTRARVRRALREGVRQGLVVGRAETAFGGERAYLFANPVVREVSYGRLPPEERGVLHRRAAGWLLARPPDEVEEHLGLIADHLERAGEVERALIYLKEAAQQAADRFANARATSYLSRALELVPEDDLEARYDLLLAREGVYALQGMHEAREADLTTLRQLAEALEDDHRRAAVALRRAEAIEAQGDYPETARAAQEAVELAQAAEDVLREAASYVQWGRALWRMGDCEGARERLEHGLTVAQVSGARHIEADGLRELGVVLWYERDFSRAQIYTELTLRIYQQLGNRVEEAKTLNNLGGLLGEQGNYAAAQDYLLQSLEVARELGYRRREGFALVNLGETVRRQGYYALAKEYLLQALEISREVGDRGFESYTLLSLGLLFYLLGENETAYEHSQKALMLAEQVGSPHSQGYALTDLGHALLALGRHKEAAERYREALEIRQETNQRTRAMESLAGLARVSLAEGKGVQALTYVEQILDYVEEHPNLGGTDEPFLVYLTCYRVLQANRDSRARELLTIAVQRLQERASLITAEEGRRSFLAQVPHHRELLAEWRAQRE